MFKTMTVPFDTEDCENKLSGNLLYFEPWTRVQLVQGSQGSTAIP